MTVSRDDPLDAVPGVGRTMRARFADELGIETVDDLLRHWPRRHDDLGDLSTVADAEIGEKVTLIGTVDSWSSRRVRQGKLHITEGDVRTPTGERFQVTFFNQPYRARTTPTGTYAAFSGKLGRWQSRPKLDNPRIENLEDLDDGDDGGEGILASRLRPLYDATAALTNDRIVRTVDAALAALPPLDEWIDEVTLAERGLLDHDTAVRTHHRPEDRRLLAAARRRNTFDELYALQLGLRWRRQRLEADVAGLDNSPRPGGLADQYVADLPFEPTGAQHTAMSFIAGDLAAPRPMHRLLQGDVGSGKTIVAVWSMLCAVDRGRQAAMMVPTEVLAEQHHRTLLDQLAGVGVNVLDGLRVELLTGRTTTTDARRILGGLLSGEVDVVVGTHALVEEGVRFADLGVVVVDEQHRFGVEQRAALIDKRGMPGQEGTGPDVLVMTATPIPRSLSLTVYGDLEVTVLDELPPGRTPVVTQLIWPDQSDRRARVLQYVRERARTGEQTFWVCPFIEPSDAMAGTAATIKAAELRDELLPDLRVGLVHGRIPAGERDATMRRLRDGELDVLVATTVIEVGLDVPTATMMIVEDAERFGISQLHQLRGRVGRGGQQAYCVLFAGWQALADPMYEVTQDSRERLEAVASTSDGFVLAERDLRIRGGGQLFGTRQSGQQDIRLATIDDVDLILAARDAAARVLSDDPDLRDHPRLAAEVRRRHHGLEGFAALETG